MHDLDANDLLLFARIAEAGSFSRAASRAGLPKSTLSRRIAALEQRLGERLLQRTPRKLHLTEFGLQVLEHARSVANEVEGAQALAQHRQAAPSGRLRVSLLPDLALTVLPQMLADFVQRYPGITLEMDLSSRRVDLIGENYDLALRGAQNLADSELSARLLADLSMHLYAAPAYLARHGMPQTPQDVQQLHGLLLPLPDGGPRPWQMQRDPAQGTEQWQGLPNSYTLANSTGMLLALASQGCGVIAMAPRFVQAYLERGELQRILPDWQLSSVRFWAVFPGRKLMPARTRLFLEALVATLGACEGDDSEK